MLIISGSAQFKLASGQYNQGDRHIITLFSVNENLDEILTAIEKHLNGLGWDDIVIEETETITSSNEVDHPVLIDAFEKAIRENISLVINNTAMTETA